MYDGGYGEGLSQIVLNEVVRTVLTEQRKLFVDEHLKLRCKNATQAAVNAGYSPKSAQSQASQILKDTEVQKYLEERKKALQQDLREEFFFDALEARLIMYQIMKNPVAENKDRLSAAKDFLDRAGFKAPEKVEVTGQLDTGQRKLDDILDQLRGNSSG